MPAEPTEEQAAATKESSRFAYQALVTEPETAAAPARGKDGHLTLASMGVGGPSGGAALPCASPAGALLCEFCGRILQASMLQVPAQHA